MLARQLEGIAKAKAAPCELAEARGIARAMTEAYLQHLEASTSP